MTQDRWSQVESLFEELDGADDRLREQRLLQVEDDEVRTEVLSLLEHSGFDGTELRAAIRGAVKRAVNEGALDFLLSSRQAASQ
jgi:hypothetical protein